MLARFNSSATSMARSAGSLVMIFSFHRLNQPSQNSMHIRGHLRPFLLKNASSTSRFSPDLEPKLAVASTPSSIRLPASNAASHAPSEVKRGTWAPFSSISLLIALKYSLSLPKEPYSFSTCIMITGPPQVACRGAIRLKSSL